MEPGHTRASAGIGASFGHMGYQHLIDSLRSIEVTQSTHFFVKK